MGFGHLNLKSWPRPCLHFLTFLLGSIRLSDIGIKGLAPDGQHAMCNISITDRVYAHITNVRDVKIREYLWIFKLAISIIIC